MCTQLPFQQTKPMPYICLYLPISILNTQENQPEKTTNESCVLMCAFCLSPCVFVYTFGIFILEHKYIYLGQVLLNDIIPHLRCIQLCVKSGSDHRHDVIDAAQARLFSQQIPACTQKKSSLPSGESGILDTLISWTHSSTLLVNVTFILTLIHKS